MSKKHYQKVPTPVVWSKVADSVITIALRPTIGFTPTAKLVIDQVYGYSRRAGVSFHTKLHVGVDLMRDYSQHYGPRTSP